MTMPILVVFWSVLLEGHMSTWHAPCAGEDQPHFHSSIHSFFLPESDFFTPSLMPFILFLSPCSTPAATPPTPASFLLGILIAARAEEIKSCSLRCLLLFLPISPPIGICFHLTIPVGVGGWTRSRFAVHEWEHVRAHVRAHVGNESVLFTRVI